jgi:hypothetical protein
VEIFCIAKRQFGSNRRETAAHKSDGSVAIPGWQMSKPQTRWPTVFVLILAGVVAALQIGKAAIPCPSCSMIWRSR